MNKLILKVIAISMTAMALLTSCKNEESLQQFYVDSSEKDGYITTSIPKTIIGIDESSLTADSQKAYQSIDKVNVLGLPATAENKAMLEEESDKLEKILKNEKYELLMSHSSDGVNVKMVYDGSQDAIDEIIVYGSSPEMGMGVARIMGKDMKVNDLMKLVSEMNGDSMGNDGLKGMINGMLLSKQMNRDTVPAE